MTIPQPTWAWLVAFLTPDGQRLLCIPVEPTTATDATRHYRVYALKYAQRHARRPEHFIGGDPHDEPMDMDYFIWAIVDPETGRSWVVDTGFSAADAAARDRELVRTAAEALASIGIDAATTTDVIMTHLHYDHIGGFEQFPTARFHLQDDEMSYATGRHMTRPAINHAYTADHIAAMVHLVFADRVVFHEGDVTLAPGLSLHKIGGHTKGLQVVRVATEIGWIVLASDASHFYENYETGRPFPIVHDLGAMLDGHHRCRQLASDPSYVVPGHDPLVFDRYPAAGPGLDGIGVRLDVTPSHVAPDT
jgi:glyoxylase-like metal-dependent hydrolase (beta-lactamase superfamily II)